MLLACWTSEGHAGPRDDPQRLHVAPAPRASRNAAGTPDRPLTLDAALTRARRAETPVELVLHAGLYRGGVYLTAPGGLHGDPLPRLTLRAARAEGGGYAEVIFDGSLPVDTVKPVEGAPGVYQTRVSGVDLKRRMQMWEEDTGLRYALVADETAVRRYRGSFWYRAPREGRHETTFFFHTSDGAPASAHRILRSAQSYGLVIRRPDVTIRGLRFRRFLAWHLAAAIASRAPGTVLEDVHVENSVRGYDFGSDARGGVVRRCSAVDVAGGVYVAGDGVTVEDCRLIRRRALTPLAAVSQNDTGIQFYYPARGGEVRGNLVVGFRNGLLIKTQPSRFRVERNTFVHPLADGERGMGPSQWHPESSYTRNVVSGFLRPLWAAQSVPRTSEVRGNCIGLPPGRDKAFDYARFGVVGRPVFVDAAGDDWRLVARTPCARIGTGGGGPGALGVAPPEVVPAGLPPHRLSLAEPANRAGAAARPGWGAGSDDAETDLARGGELWLAAEPRVALHLRVDEDPRRATRMRVRIGDGPWSASEPVRTRRNVELPGRDGAPVSLEVELRDGRGRWHALAPLRVLAGEGGPRALEPVSNRSSEHGFLVSVVSDRPCGVRLEYGPTAALGSTSAALVHRNHPEGTGAGPTVHVVRLRPPEVAPGRRYHWRLVLHDALGRQTEAGRGTFQLSGPPRSLHVSPRGRDAADRGTRQQPLATLQYALDRALPGDHVELGPGLYTGSAALWGGGVEGAPIVIRANPPEGAFLDGRRSVDHLLQLVRAPHVIVEGLELRWFRRAAINLFESPGVVIRNNRIWNDFWFGWVEGGGIHARKSPGLRVERNVIYKTREGMLLQDSPDAQIVANTTARNMGGAVRLLRSVAGTSILHNSFAFEDQHVYVLVPEDPGALGSFRSDWNNLGLFFRKPHRKELGAVREDREELEPRERVFQQGASKFLIRVQGIRAEDLPGVAPSPGRWKIREPVPRDLRFYSLEDWRGASGQDRHSIFADPRYVDPETGDFRLRPESPNLGAGREGHTIGALEVAGPSETPAAAGPR